MKPTAVVVDDDALARERLKDLIAEVPLVELVGEAADGGQAVELIDEIEPDIAFLDVEMPALSGVQVAQRIRRAPVLIFTTAYRHYAVTAFELAAVDYLLKPFGPERLREALTRAVAAVSSGGDREALRARAGAALTQEGPLTRIFLRERSGIRPVLVSDIQRFESDGDYTILHSGAKQHLVRLRIQDLEARLGERFLRVHRSHLVNLDHVELFEQHDDTRLAVVLTDGTRIVASRAKSRDLRRLAH